MLLHRDNHRGIELAHIGHGILVIILHQTVNIGIGIDEEVRQQERIHLLLHGIEVAGAVEEQALHAPFAILAETLLHHVQDGIRG